MPLKEIGCLEPYVRPNVALNGRCPRVAGDEKALVPSFRRYVINNTNGPLPTTDSNTRLLGGEV